MKALRLGVIYLFSVFLAACTPALTTSIPTPAADLQSVSWSGFGPVIRLDFPPGLAQQVTPAVLPAEPMDQQMMFALTHPALAQFRFTGYPAYPDAQLPYPLDAPQIMVYKTEDFSRFANGTSLDFPSQRQALSDLLDAGIDPARCEKPLHGPDEALPFLPWVNSAQAFCAQPEVLEFMGGKGVRFLTYYAQDMGPAVDPGVFYTFQGLSADGAYYISAVFPLQTGVFPTEPPECPKCSDPNYDPVPDWQRTLADQLSQLNNLAGDELTPSLAELDAMIQSIRFE